jgi:uncharacterized lipoprotein
MRRLWIRFVVLGITAVLVAGCFGSNKRKLKKCHKPQEYQQAKPGPRVRVPEGKQELPGDERLRLPYGETQTAPIPKGQPCLEEPPEF